MLHLVRLGSRAMLRKRAKVALSEAAHLNSTASVAAPITTICPSAATSPTKAVGATHATISNANANDTNSETATEHSATNDIPSTVATALLPKSVLHQCKNFLCFNKPFDVRMNGEFDITVEKMTRSYIASTLGMGSASIHCVHRLDYATSGILCVALNKKAAQVASKVFELRLASKKYTALVYGHINVNDVPFSKIHKDLPPLPLTLAECRRAVPPCRTVHCFYGHHRRSTKEKMARAEVLSRVEKVLLSTRSFKEFQIACKTDDLVSTTDPASPALIKSSAKKAKAEYEATIRRRYIEGNRLQNTTWCTDPDTGTQKKCPVMCIDVGIAQPEDRRAFRMLVPKDVPATADKGTFSPKWRAARTLMRVQALGFYKGRPVTRVLLEPRSGRRHQLRLHMAFLNHPIVGDVTYCADTPYKSCAEKEERMMLHALSLHLPFKDAPGFDHSGDMVAELRCATDDPFRDLVKDS